MKNTWILTGIAILLYALTVSCAAHPPSELIILDDHAALARWYDRQAVQLREKATDMQRMMEEYNKPTFVPSAKETKDGLIAHCQLFIKLYSETAREAETLANLHRDLVKTAR